MIDSQSSFDINAQIVLVLSNRKAAYGLTRATNANPPIPTAYLALQPWLKANTGKTRDDYDAEIARMVLKVKPDLVVLAGWMHIFGDGFLDLLSQPSPEASELSFPPEFKFPIPVINLHPALPGVFDGAHALDRAWEAFKDGKLDKTGVMVHRVVRQVDAGEPILVQEIPFDNSESKEQFEERLHGVEWKVIVGATNIMLKQRWEQCKS